MPERIQSMIAANCAAAVMIGLGIWIVLAVMSLAALAATIFTSSFSPSDFWPMINNVVVVGPIVGIISAVVSFPIYLAGLIVAGIPTWIAFHRMGWTSSAAFIAGGAFESVAAGILLALLIAPSLVGIATLLALPGGLAGWVIWRSGYEREPRPLPPPAPPS